MSLRALINTNKMFKPLKPIIKPISEIIWGLNPFENWLKIIALNDKIGETIVDVGASEGLFLQKAARFFPNINYLVIEPREEVLEKLNIQIERLGINATLLNVALSDQSGYAQMDIFSHRDASSLKLGGNGIKSEVLGSIQIPTKTLDEIIPKKNNSKNIKIIKIDVEGFELNVLRGATNSLINSKNLIIELSPLRHSNYLETIDCFKLIFNSGFMLVDSSDLNFYFSSDPIILKNFGYEGRL